jgi:hypothetical protein
MIAMNCSPTSMKSVDQAVKRSSSGESVQGESAVIEVEHHTPPMSNPSGTGEALVGHTSSQRTGTPTKVINYGSDGRTERVDSRTKTQAHEGGGGSPGLFGAAMLLLRGSTNLRGVTNQCTTTGSGGDIDPLMKSITAVDAITPDESNGGSALDGCPHRDNVSDGTEERRGRLRVASGPYQHALFTAPDSLHEQESDRLPLVTINVSSHASLPEKRRRRTKHVVTYKKRKVIRSHPSAPSTAPSAQTRRTTAGVGTQGKADSSAKTGLVPSVATGPASNGEVVPCREPLRPSRTGICPKTETYGITKRLSDNYQAQVFFARKSRYIGVFRTPADAALAVAEVKKELSKYKKPFEGDGDVAFRKARDVALEVMGKGLSCTEPSKVSQCSTSTRPDAPGSDRSASSNDRLDEKRKPQGKGNGAPPGSRSSGISKCKTDTSLSLLLLAAAADAENDRGNNDTKVPKTSKATSGKVDLTETEEDAAVGNENISSLSKQQNVQTTGDRKSTSHRHKKAASLSRADPRFRAPGIRPQSLTCPSSTAHSLAESRSFPPEIFEYICSRRVYPSREVFITLDISNRVYVSLLEAVDLLKTRCIHSQLTTLLLLPVQEVHVSDDNLYPDKVISLGPMTNEEKARKLFEIVCSIANHAGEKYWYMLPDLGGALDLNQRMVPHMPPPLIRGYLGIAFVVESLDWVRTNAR